MDMLMGALGALFVMGLLALGFFTGWKARGRFYRPEAKPASENELRRLHAEQTVFNFTHRFIHRNGDNVNG